MRLSWVSIKSLFLLIVMAIGANASFADDSLELPPLEDAPMDTSAIGESLPPESSPAQVTEIAPVVDPALEPASEPVAESGTMDPNATVGPVTHSARSLIEIEAQYYDVSVVRPSQSKRIYLLAKSSGALPDLGRVILAKIDGNPVMGFRVVKVYPEKQEIAVKAIKTYEGHSELSGSESLRAYEKVGEITQVPANSPEDINDLKDIETAQVVAPVEVAPPAMEAVQEPAPEMMAQVDSSAPVDTTAAQNLEPAPPEEIPPSEPAVTEESLALSPLESPIPPPADSLQLEPGTELAANEGSSTTAEMDQSVRVASIDSDEDQDHSDDEEVDYTEEEMIKNLITIDGGFIQGQNLPGGNTSVGGGLTYSRYLSTRIFDSSGRGAPDALAAELGVFYYKNAGDVTIDGTSVSQSFTVMPVTMKLRYHFSLSPERMGFYVYGGFLFNRITSQIGATDDELKLAQTTMPAVGLGVMIPTGPGWYLKLNAGTDFMGAGLAFRF